MKVRIVCRTDQLDWILGKIARQLVRELEPLVDVSLGPLPDDAAQINHHVWYDDYRGGGAPATIGITHIDSIRKLEMVRDQLESALAGICMSRQQMTDLIHAGLPRQKLCYVTPAHDGVITPRKIHVGITTRLYTPDPCKREWMLEELARQIQPSDFCFSIMGAGWEPIVAALRQRGFEVDYFAEFSLDRYRVLLPTFDYYLYLGWDEGSMGFLDALQAGVKTIATAQGFHLDVEGGLTHPIGSPESLLAVFEEIARERRIRTSSVRELTWALYARKHLEIWQYLLAQGGRTVTNTYADGLNSLVGPGPVRDPARGRAYRAELHQIDQERAERAQFYRG
jgi:hypothetical protein